MDQTIRRWLSEALSAEEIDEVRSLTFGISSELTVLSADGTPVVLRVYRDDHVLDVMPGVVDNEFAALRAARPVLGDLVPEPLVCDRDGTRAGRPAIAMSLLPGTPRIGGLDPARLARPLARLHRHPPPPELSGHRPWFDPSSLGPPAWSADPSVWITIIGVVQDGTDGATDSVFLHRDYHPGNLLWEDDELSGIVDWAFSCTGPRGVDVAHMRANLALIEGIEAADHFLAAYQQDVPSYVHDLWWDAAELMAWDEEFRGVMAFNAWLSDHPLTLEDLRIRCGAWACHLANELR